LNSADLTQDSKTELDNVFELLKQNRNIVLEIAAHTDDLGDDTYNLQLSNARAKSVKEYLLSLGVPEMMLVSKGYGESMPAVRNDSEENRKLNRRVEFLVLDAK
jgi:outer membrane protein OmpA-like peptidoglycan-associated protein